MGVRSSSGEQGNLSPGVSLVTPDLFKCGLFHPFNGTFPSFCSLCCSSSPATKCDFFLFAAFANVRFWLHPAIGPEKQDTAVRTLNVGVKPTGSLRVARSSFPTNKGWCWSFRGFHVFTWWTCVWLSTVCVSSYHTFRWVLAHRLNLIKRKKTPVRKRYYNNISSLCR